mmetsp:Transcript_8196/g.10345  ORF Transcript_8196/g.10345 Transcript_8196/m.10345 type:complete len:86 (-) Transcript_8196:1362-1619(-)
MDYFFTVISECTDFIGPITPHFGVVATVDRNLCRMLLVAEFAIGCANAVYFLSSVEGLQDKKFGRGCTDTKDPPIWDDEECHHFW